MTPLSRRDFLRSSTAFLIGAPLFARTGLAIGMQPGMEIVPREQWATDRPPKGPMETEEVKFLLVHHTASGNDYARDDVPRLLRGFYDLHTGNARGWNDIAYNFLIDRFGRVWEGRAGSLVGPVAGDATGGNQGFTQLCAIIGNFTDVMPSEASLDALDGVLAWLAARYRVPTRAGATATFTSRGSNRWPEGSQVTTATISGHRDMSRTACPGDTFYPYVKEQLALRVDTRRRPLAPDRLLWWWPQRHSPRRPKHADAPEPT